MSVKRKTQENMSETKLPKVPRLTACPTHVDVNVYSIGEGATQFGTVSVHLMGVWSDARGHLEIHLPERKKRYSDITTINRLLHELPHSDTLLLYFSCPEYPDLDIDRAFAASWEFMLERFSKRMAQYMTVRELQRSMLEPIFQLKEDIVNSRNNEQLLLHADMALQVFAAHESVLARWKEHSPNLKTDYVWYYKELARIKPNMALLTKQIKSFL